jgi:hypothetical protein
MGEIMEKVKRVFLFHRDKHDNKIRKTFQVCNSVFMVLTILWLGAIGTLAAKTKMKDDDGYVKKDNKIYKLAVLFFFVSMFFALMFFHLGDHLNA